MIRSYDHQDDVHAQEPPLNHSRTLRSRRADMVDPVCAQSSGAEAMETDGVNDNMNSSDLSKALNTEETAILAAFDRLNNLPPHSQYVIHRRKVLTRALMLVEKKKYLSKNEVNELEELMTSLKL